MRPTSRRSCVGFVSHMFFHCHELRLHCFLLSVAWFQLALISSDCFESFFQSVKYGWIVCPGRLPAEVTWKRHLSWDFSPNHVTILNGVVTMWGRVNPKVLGSNSAKDLLFPFFLFFSFLFCLVRLFVLLFFFLFLKIYLNNCY